MDLLAELTKEHSKAQTEVIAEFFVQNPKAFPELIHIFLNGEYRATQRAAWVIRTCFINKTTLVEPYFKELLQKLYQPPFHDAIKRNVMAIFADYKAQYPEKLHEQLLEKAFEYLADRSEKVAIKVHSMTVAEKLCSVYPELKTELRILLEDQMEFGSAGFKSRAMKILKRIKNP